MVANTIETTKNNNVQVSQLFETHLKMKCKKLFISFFLTQNQLTQKAAESFSIYDQIPPAFCVS